MQLTQYKNDNNRVNRHVNAINPAALILMKLVIVILFLVMNILILFWMF